MHNHYTRPDRASKKTTPTVKRYPIKTRIKEPRHLELSSLSELLPLVIDHSVYVNATPSEFLSLFRILNHSQISALARREWVSVGDVSIKLHADREDGYIVARQGNRYGTIINLHRIAQNRPTGEILPILDDLFGRNNLPHGDFRTPGNVAAHILDSLRSALYLPKEPHLNRFVNSFRGPRFEAILFGRIPKVNDYDISSAYPSELAKCLPTTGLIWKDSTDKALIGSAVYAAALCDVWISKNLERGPIAYRCRDEALYFPIGKLPRCWLNLPEMQYLTEKGYRFDIIEGSFGLPMLSSQSPFYKICQRLYKMRLKYPEQADYIKKVSVGIFGKLISSHDGISGPGYNPVVASHVTSSIRIRLQRLADQGDIVGEYVDGLATTSEYDQSSGMGGLKLEGSGEYISITDHFKQSDWKTPAIPFVEAIPESKGRTITTELRAIVGPASIAHNLAPASAIGEIRTHEVRLQVGPFGRLPTRNFSAKDLLTDIVETAPVTLASVPALSMTTWSEIPGALSYDLAT